jgi:hypothetical protein|tara:strand:+ start:259 stop:786 length:528 start_codon:yes stop_codon:yes gene_type:complete
VPPITVVFVGTGLVVWLNALFFLGVGADTKEDSPSPLVSVGWATLIVGLLDLVQATYIMWARPLEDASVPLAGLIVFYGLFFCLLGITEIQGLDLRVVGNLAIAVAIVPLFWWQFFDGGWMFKSILLAWVVAFGAVAATTYGKFQGKALGAILAATAAYTFWTPAIILALGNQIP